MSIGPLADKWCYGKRHGNMVVFDLEENIINYVTLKSVMCDTVTGHSFFFVLLRHMIHSQFDEPADPQF